MMILLVSTCGGAADMVALADTSATEKLIASRPLLGRTSSEQILPALRELLANTRCSVADLEAVVVVDGPGSFTGVRVGLSVAKGLCEAASIPLVTISRLALLASQAEPAGPYLALLDAGRGEFFAGLYHAGICEREMLLRADQLTTFAGRRSIIASEAKVAEALADLNATYVPEPGADAVLDLALIRIAAGLWTDIAAADANYQRRTDAELLVERQTALLS